jgi:hypothetical protein
MRTLRLALVVPSLVSLLAVTGCGGDDTQPIKKDTRIDAGKKDGGPRRDSGTTDQGTLPDVSLDRDLPVSTDTRPDQGLGKDLPASKDAVAEHPVGSDARPDGYIPPPSFAYCAKPRTLNFPTPQPGDPLKLTETGRTDTSQDEFPGATCNNGSGWSWDGPQLYYKVTLPGGKKYKVTLTTDFDAALYAFPAATACKEADINAACTNPPADPDKVYNSDLIGSSAVERLHIAPAQTEDWIITVDSYSAFEYGSFTLTISEVTVPANATCQTAKGITVPAAPAKLTESGDTTGAQNATGNPILCGGTAAFAGAQVYYKLPVAAGKSYRFALSPTFSAVMYVFPATANCDPAAINTACGSGGATGAVLGSTVSAGSKGTLVFKPATPGDYIIAIDSKDPLESNLFDLVIDEFELPTNGVCALPKTLTLTTSPVTEPGDTTGVPNQFGSNIDCGSVFQYVGPQQYYLLVLQAGKTYTIKATPTGWDLALYAFTDATCVEANINSQCGDTTKPPNVFFADEGYSDDPETLTIAPTGTGTVNYLLAVDSYDPGEYGSFALEITWP